MSKKVSFLPYYTIHSFVGILIGGAVLMFAPGNFVRLKYSGLELGFNLSRIINYWSYEINWILSYIKYLWIIFFLISFSIFIFSSVSMLLKIDSFLIFIYWLYFNSFIISIPCFYHNCTNLFFYYCLLIFLLSLFNTDMISNKILNFTFIIIFLISIAFQGYMLVNQKKFMITLFH